METNTTAALEALAARLAAARLAGDELSARIVEVRIAAILGTPLAVELADHAGIHVTTIDGFATVEEAVAYVQGPRPGSAIYAGLDVCYFATDDGVTTGAELRHPITGALEAQLVAHPAGWVPAGLPRYVGTEAAR